MEIIFYIPSPGTEFIFSYLLFCTDFPMVLTFPGLRIEAPQLSTVHGKCTYNIFKAENQETQFPLLYAKPIIDKHKLSSFQGGRFISHLCLACTVSLADLLVIRSTIVESSGPICQSSVPSRHVLLGRFIGQPQPKA